MLREETVNLKNSKKPKMTQSVHQLSYRKTTTNLEKLLALALSEKFTRYIFQKLRPSTHAQDALSQSRRSSRINDIRIESFKSSLGSTTITLFL